MTKKNITISVDVDVYEKHKARGSNISDLCNCFLANYGSNIKRIQERAIAKSSELVKTLEAQKKVEARNKEIADMLAEARKYRTLKPNKMQLILRNICERYGLDWAEVVQRMERASLPLHPNP